MRLLLATLLVSTATLTACDLAKPTSAETTTVVTPVGGAGFDATSPGDGTPEAVEAVVPTAPTTGAMGPTTTALAPAPDFEDELSEFDELGTLLDELDDLLADL